MKTADLTADSLVLILLCSHLGLPKQGDRRPTPLSAPEWRGLDESLLAHGWERPRELLGRTATDLGETLMLDGELAERIVRLLDRSGQVAIELDRLASSGIWALTGVDPGYPAKLRERLGARAPVVFFGAGPAGLLSRGGVAVVGSRDLTPAAEGIARELGRCCAELELVTISGGARGTDRVAMLASLDADGQSVGILGDGLERSLRDSEVSRHIRCGNLTLVTPFHPAAAFDVGNAMARNKLIYGLADHAIVVASSLERGGTWFGAVEDLRAGWVPLHVVSDLEASAGNQELIRRGGRPLSSWLLHTQGAPLTELLRLAATHPPRAAEQTTKMLAEARVRNADKTPAKQERAGTPEASEVRPRQARLL